MPASGRGAGIIEHVTPLICDNLIEQKQLQILSKSAEQPAVSSFFHVNSE
jgi:hypothetical protein